MISEWCSCLLHVPFYNFSVYKHIYIYHIDVIVRINFCLLHLRTLISVFSLMDKTSLKATQLFELDFLTDLLMFNKQSISGWSVFCKLNLRWESKKIMGMFLLLDCESWKSPPFILPILLFHVKPYMNWPSICLSVSGSSDVLVLLFLPSFPIPSCECWFGQFIPDQDPAIVWIEIVIVSRLLYFFFLLSQCWDSLCHVFHEVNSWIF